MDPSFIPCTRAAPAERVGGRACTAVLLSPSCLVFFRSVRYTRRDKARTEGYLSAKKSLRPFIMHASPFVKCCRRFRDFGYAVSREISPGGVASGARLSGSPRCLETGTASRRAAESRSLASLAHCVLVRRSREDSLFRARNRPSGCFNCAGKASTLRPRGGADVFIGDDASGVSLDLSNKNRGSVQRSGGRSALSLSRSPPDAKTIRNSL